MKRAFLAALLVGTAAPASAADIGVEPLGNDGQLVGIYGEIQPNDFEAFKAKAGRLTGKVAVALHGPGGALIAALQIGEYVRLKGWGTFVLDECYSACASVWLAGSPRLMTPQAKIGFHAASLGGLEKGRGNALVGAYMNRLGLSYAAIGWATEASPDDMALLTPSKAKELGIDVTLLEPNDKQANAQPTAPPLEIRPRPAPPASADDPYKEGTRDYYSGLCYRARPYLDGPPEKAALWESGFRDAQRRDQDKVDRSYCFPRANAKPDLRDCSAISAEMTLFFPDKFDDCYIKPAANAPRFYTTNYATQKTWDRYIPSSGRYITRTLEFCTSAQCVDLNGLTANSMTKNSYRLIAKDHDNDGGSNGGSVCYFTSTRWSDCETNMGEHYQLKAGSIQSFLSIANGADPGAEPAAQPARPAPAAKPAPKPKVATARPNANKPKIPRIIKPSMCDIGDANRSVPCCPPGFISFDLFANDAVCQEITDKPAAE